MTDSKPLGEQNQTPEDVATLYSWANLHGAKYRDFSAARALTREKARVRAEQAVEEERERIRQAAEAAEAERAAHAAKAGRAAEEAHAAEQARQAEQARLIEQARQAEMAAAEADRQQQEAARQQEEAARQARERAAQEAREQAARQLAQHAAEHIARMEGEQAARQAAHEAAERATQLAVERAREQAAKLAAQQEAEKAAQQRTWQPPRTERIPMAPQSPPPAYAAAQSFDFTGSTHTQAYRPPQAPPLFGPVRDQASAPERPHWDAPEARETATRPAWLSAESQQTAAAQPPQTPLPQSPEDTLQGSRDRLASRWFALRNVFDPATPQPEAVPAPTASRAPSMAVFSLAGGVGKTSLVATLGRALAARGERVLLVDTAAFGLLPFFFGATDQRPGQLRTFNPPGVSSDAPVQMVTIDPEGLGPEQGGAESLSGEIAKFARGASRILVDLATASGATTRRIMRMAPLVLVPVVADMNSVVSVSSIDAFFEHNNIHGGKPVLPYYVLNQFDATLPLHLDVREVLREQLGERLLPFALRRTPAMSEALAEGMTVMDYAPGSALTEDFATLAGWVKSLSAPATTSYRGVRWSER
jgi:cellulose synthase operon protein YhjQ